MRYRLVLTSVLQAAVLWTANELVFHHFLSDLIDKAAAEFANNTAFDPLEGAVHHATNNSFTIGNNTISNGTTWSVNGQTYRITDVTYTNSTASDGGSTRVIPKSFYLNELPIGLLVAIVLFVLQYYWQTLLERSLPTRKVRTKQVVNSYSKLDEAVDEKEDELIEKLVARGRVQRASLSWCNVLAKWLLDICIGSLWINGLRVLLKGLLLTRNFSGVLADFKMDFLIEMISSLFSIMPLVSLASFILVPAPKRIVFRAGTTLIWDCFVAGLSIAILPWLSRVAWLQKAIRDGQRQGHELAPLRDEI